MQLLELCDVNTKVVTTLAQYSFTSQRTSMGVLAKDLSMTQLLAPSSQRLVLLELRGVYPVVDLPPRK